MEYTNQYGAKIKLVRKGAVLSKSRGKSKEFNVLQLGSQKFFDIRQYENHTSRKVMLNGISLSMDEAKVLRDALIKIEMS